MGTWGTGSFDNDTARDWIYVLQESQDLSVLRQTLAALVQVGGEYLGAPEAEEGIAAAEVVAVLSGFVNKRAAVPSDVKEWVSTYNQSVDPALLGLASEAMERVLCEPSELVELWLDTDSAGSEESLADLRERLADAITECSQNLRGQNNKVRSARKWWRFWA